MTDKPMPQKTKQDGDDTQVVIVYDEWGIKFLGEIADSFIGGGTPSTEHQEYWNGNIHWTTSKRINGIFLYDSEKKITRQGLEESSTHLIPKGNLIIGTRVGVGKAAVNKIDIAISQDLTGVFIDSSKYNPTFLAYQITTKGVQNRFLECTRGTTIKGIPREDLKKISLKIPPLSEQKNIATVLSSLQDTIARTGAVIESLRNLKKAMMRHLFTYGPVAMEETEQVRLKDTEIGMMPEGWSLVQIQKICEKIQDGTHFSPKNKKERGRMYITSKNIRPFRLDIANVEFIDEIDHQKIYRRCSVKRGDLLFTKDGANTGNCVVNPLEEEFSLLSSVCLMRPKACILNHFLCQYINSSEGRRIIRASMAGSAINRLTLEKIFIILVPLPPLPIQQKIAEILSCLDAKIQAEESKKASLETLFKTLLELLMTGKIRITSLEQSL